MALVLAGASLVIFRPGPVDDWLGGNGSASPSPQAAPPPPSSVLAGSSKDVPAPTAAGVQALLDPLVADKHLGPKLSISVVDVATKQSLYARGGDNPATPASTTKLVTAVTVLAARGPTYRIPTVAVAGSTPGEVVLIGGGDPTLAASATPTYPGAARLDDLAAQVKKSLGATPPSKVVVDSTLFSGPPLEPGWDGDIPTGGFGARIAALMTDGARVNPKQVKDPAERFQKPDIAAGQAFARALGLPSTAVAPGKAAQTPVNAASPAAASAAPDTSPGAQLGKVESPPIGSLVEMMLSASDNVIAETMARQVALAKGQPASFVGAAAAEKTVLTELGLPAAQGAVADGSGLSRSNRVTPSLLTGLLTVAASPEHPNLHGLFAGLPVAGYSGTLRQRYTEGTARPGAGLVRAKTGTLTGVNAISGTVTTQDGRLLAFALLANATVDPFGTQDALDRIATALASCGCR